MKACILNSGGGSWAFEEHAQRLSRAMNLEISDSPTDFNYVLGWEGAQVPDGQSFIPLQAISMASDKRRLAQVFAEHEVATPRTELLESQAEVAQVIEANSPKQWVLKWPTGCGGSGHRLQSATAPIPTDWPRPLVLQEFIRLEVPQVYRLYGVAGQTFGWNARRFSAGAGTSPFVAHAQGARYEEVGQAPHDAEIVARHALSATGLLDSFGCADLMQDDQGNWLALEVNTDGIFNHVDRDISIGNIAQEIDERLAVAFWAWCKS
ncbi:ATP-grasp domain-containing protein [Abditibacterium utsteinense]|uniref:ATP-grasp domain-containing protein n=1 Tax=Abditibacterium utsteinense TaxID=1960156 RepID=A0A2S8SU88_9BACT|nr:ATP-grasp domain-containing protein [Abditibacterium utsteinense]PQV64364.1 ATP-grasp domain-containing protein [Abditibacterium utsteinense]